MVHTQKSCLSQLWKLFCGTETPSGVASRDLFLGLTPKGSLIKNNVKFNLNWKQVTSTKSPLVIFEASRILSQ